MATQLAGLGLQYEFFDGVDGAELTEAEIAKVYKPWEAFRLLGRELHRNELACSWSHIKVYERIVREGIEECLVLEDDIDLDDSLPALLETRRNWLPDGWRLINFAHDMAEPSALRPIKGISNDQFQLCRFDSLVGRTGAYLVRLEAAISLLKTAYPIRMPPDDLAGDSSFVGGEILGVVPRVARWDDEYASTIWSDQSREEFSEQSRSGLKGLIWRIRRRINKVRRHRTGSA